MSQVGASASASIACTLLDRFVDILSPMGEFSQMYRVMDLTLERKLDTHQSHSSGFRSWVEFECHWLEMALFHTSVLESNGKWHNAMHHGSMPRKQQTCSLLRAGHERLFVLI
jgi:hypothetical protein